MPVVLLLKNEGIKEDAREHDGSISGFDFDTGVSGRIVKHFGDQF
jgi:hypothetical protein